MAITAINLSSLDGSNGFLLDGEFAPGLPGYSVSNAGDVNGDGFDDVIIGSPHFPAVPEDEYIPGSSYIVFGKASVFGATLDLSSLDGSNGFRIDGAAAYDRSGRSVSSAGDLNGDGFDDVIVAARGIDASYVVFGRASGFSAIFDLSSLDGNNGFRLDEAGIASVSSAGDVNGDGFDDVIVGAPGADPNGNSSGTSYVVFGKATGFDVELDLSSLDGNNGFRLDGMAAYDETGNSVSSAGDVNGDDFDDVIVGAPGSNANYIVFGRASGFSATLNLSSLDGNNGFRLDGAGTNSVSSAGDVNGDDFADVIVGASGTGASYVIFGSASGFSATLDLSSLNGNNGFRLDGAGTDSVSSAGDVNGDGFDDVIVGAPYAVPSGAGSSYVVFGKVSGFDAMLDLSNLDSDSGFRLDGVAANDNSGSSVSGAGDVNGDGFDDMVIGAHNPFGYGDSSGFTYVVFGRSDFGGTGVTHPGTPGNDHLVGTMAADIFDAGDGNDNLIGRGGADLFDAGAGDDNIRVSDLNFQSTDGGSGNDVLHLTGKDLNLDLGSLGSNISGIETICLYGNGDNALTVTAAGLLDLSDSTNTLKVNGNAGDHIIGLSSGWTDEGARGDGYFHVYTQGDAVLLVGANVTTDFPVA